jgi:bacterial/archaeal transporter family protein
MWMLYAFGSAVAASLVAIFGKIGLQGVDATQATVVRGVVMALLLVLGGIAIGKFNGFSFEQFSGKAWLFILLSALAGAASWMLYFIALQNGPASAVAVIDKLSVVFVILLAAIFLGESLTIKSGTGVVLTVLGTLLILFK